MIPALPIGVLHRALSVKGIAGTLYYFEEELLNDRATNTTLRLAESLLDRPYVTAKRVQKLCDVTAPTAQKAIDALVDHGILTEITGQKRNRMYLSPRIMDAVYGSVGRDNEPAGAA